MLTPDQFAACVHNAHHALQNGNSQDAKTIVLHIARNPPTHSHFAYAVRAYVAICNVTGDKPLQLVKGVEP